MALPSINPNIGQALLDVPMGDMIRQMATSIADAQIRLDENSMEVAEMMGGLKTIVGPTGEVTFEDSRVYFGTEETTLAGILELYNTSNDKTLRAAIWPQLSSYTTVSESDTAAAYGDLVSAADDELPLIPDNDNIRLDGETTYKINTYAGGEPKHTRVGIDKLLFPAGDSATYSARVSMMELGFAPTFYQFVDTIIEVKISISYTQEESRTNSLKISNTNKSRSFAAGFGFRRGIDARRGKTVTTAQVNSTFASKYSYTAEGSSLLRTKLVPIPPPAILEERIRKTLENDTPPPAND